MSKKLQTNEEVIATLERIWKEKGICPDGVNRYAQNHISSDHLCQTTKCFLGWLLFDMYGDKTATDIVEKVHFRGMFDLVFDEPFEIGNVDDSDTDNRKGWYDVFNHTSEVKALSEAESFLSPELFARFERLF